MSEAAQDLFAGLTSPLIADARVRLKLPKLPRTAIMLTTRHDSKRAHALKALDRMTEEVWFLTKGKKFPQNDTMHRNLDKLAEYAEYAWDRDIQLTNANLTSSLKLRKTKFIASSEFEF